MKVAVIFNSNYIDWPFGGMLTYLKAILPHLDETFELDIWGCSVDGIFQKEVNIDGKKYEIRKLGNMRTRNKLIPNILIAMGNMVKIAKQIESMNYEIIYFQESFYCSVYTMINKHRTSKIVYHLHGCLSNTPKRILQILSIKNADLVLENCDGKTIQWMKKKYALKKDMFLQMPTGIDTNYFIPFNGNKNTLRNELGYKQKNIFIYAGRFAKVKDIPLAVLAHEVYCKMYERDSLLLLIGDGEEKKKIKDLVDRLQLNDNVKIMDKLPREKLVSYYQISDAFIMPSKGEGMAFSVLESKACGTPVIGFDVNGIRDSIDNMKNGVILSNRKPKILADAMKYVVDNQEILSAGARANAEKYSREIIAKRISDAIKDIITE